MDGWIVYLLVIENTFEKCGDIIYLLMVQEKAHLLIH